MPEPAEPVSIHAWLAHRRDRRPAGANLGPEEPRDLDAAATAAHYRQAAVRIFDKQVPPRFRHARADHPDVRAWVRQFLASPDGLCDSLIMVGGTGSGKTHQAWGALRAIAESGHRPVAFRFANEADMLAELQCCPIEEREVRYHGYAAAPLLVLDDLGVAKWSEASEKFIYRLLNHRHDQMLPTILTSNLQGPEQPSIAEKWSDRVASRLAGMCRVRIELIGPDRRRGMGAR